MKSYTYGYLDKVLSVSEGGQPIGNYHYSADGMLTAKTRDGVTEPWLWDGIALAGRGSESFVNDHRSLGRLGGECRRQPEGRDERERASQPHASGGTPVVHLTTEGPDSFRVADYLGTSLASIDAADSGNVENLLLASMGQGAEALDASARFTGKPFDPDLGAFVFPYRNYDPESARWLTSDPAGFPDGPNSHFYALVPTSGLDPWGVNVLSPYHVDLQDDITEMISDSDWGSDSAHEEGGWIVYDDEQDEYSIERWTPDPEKPDRIDPTPRPENAVGDVHTHSFPNDGPSPGDLPYQQEDKTFVINPLEVWQVLEGGVLFKWPRSPIDA